MGDVKEAMAALLPYLRRYARAAAADPDRGDPMVERALARFAAATGGTVAEPDLRLRLFSLLQVVLREEERRRPAPSTPPRDAAIAAIVAASVRELDLAKRQALLLTRLEGFSADEAAEILNCSATRIEALTAAAMDDLAMLGGPDRHPPAAVLVLGTDAAAGREIARAVRRCGHCVLGIAGDAAAARAIADKAPPALVVADGRPEGRAPAAVNAVLAGAVLAGADLAGHAAGLVLVGGDEAAPPGMPAPSRVIALPLDDSALGQAIDRALAGPPARPAEPSTVPSAAPSAGVGVGGKG